MKSCAALLLTVIVIMLSTSAEAVSIVNAEATLDWTGFAFTTTGTLSATMTTKSDQRASTSAIASGSATAAGSAVDGFVILSAGAVATAPALLTSTSRAILFGDNQFWFTGTGVGSLVVTIPYHLEISSSQTSNNDFASANVSVELFRHPPGVGSSASDALSLTGAGAMSRDGVLNVSLPLVDPSATLVGFFLQSEVNVSAAVPEETNSALLLSISLLVIGAFGRRWALGA